MTRDISEAQIRYISTTTIRPATQQDHKDGQQSHQKIHLSPWDLKSLVRPYMQRGLLFANPKQRKQDAEKIITQLKTSLSCALDHFYPLAGRIATTAHDDNTVSFFIDCKPAGAEFVHASADVTIAEIMDSTHVPRIVQHSFFTLNDVVNYDGRSKPLLSIQVTELIDGFFVGCSINHTVCDGKSFWLFFNSWCEISRRGSSAGDQHISCLPIFDRSCLMNNMEKDLPIRFPLSTVESWQGYKYIPPPLDERVFIFTEENIAKLKAKANSNITAFALNQTAKEDADHKKVIISSLQAVLAHVWVAVTRARCLDPNEVTVYYLAIGATGRLNPPLPKLFFGNSSMGEAATAKVSELLEVGGFELGASLLNAVVRSFDDAKIRSFGKSWMKKPEVNKMDYYLSNNSLQTGGSPRFNMFGNDFGCGEPIAVRSGSANKCDGKITSTPGPVSGSIGIEACLSAKTLKALENDTEFMRYITI